MSMLKEKIEKVIKEAGRYVKNVDYSHVEMHSKLNFRDLCTEHDEKTLAFLYAELKKILPEAKFIGEEDSHSSESLEGYCFIIDPIDGTTNFALDYHHSAISIALVKDGEVVLGMVYNPYLDELFWAEKGKGAYVNEKPISVYDTDLKHSLLGFGTSPYHMELAKETFDLTYSIYPHVMDIRRCGSAALDICYVAANRQNVFFETILQPWDYAAASLILSEAGGMITDMLGGRIDLLHGCSICAGNGRSHAEFIDYYKSFKERRG